MENTSMKPGNNFIMPGFPKVVRIEPSAFCNLRCRHCPTGHINIARG